MRFLELNNLCHRHLRASNVIVQHETVHMYSIKITDYMIPYHFLDKANIWAFGCVMFEIMHGLAPYTFQKKRPESYYDLQKMLGRGETMVIIKENDQSTFMDNILLRCLNHDPKARPTFDHLYNFFRELLFDFTLGAESAIKKYFSEVSDTIEHKYEGRIKKITDN
uniref:Protein kinase domain-containing protein n=1 Tax=Heterorhabditis bacteriophora TaxID=37862 RepID=A0A1I7XNK9_HETBA